MSAYFAEDPAPFQALVPESARIAADCRGFVRFGARLGRWRTVVGRHVTGGVGAGTPAERGALVETAGSQTSCLNVVPLARSSPCPGVDSNLKGRVRLQLCYASARRSVPPRPCQAGRTASRLVSSVRFACSAAWCSIKCSANRSAASSTASRGAALQALLQCWRCSRASARPPVPNSRLLSAEGERVVDRSELGDGLEGAVFAPSGHVGNCLAGDAQVEPPNPIRVVASGLNSACARGAALRRDHRRPRCSGARGANGDDWRGSDSSRDPAAQRATSRPRLAEPPWSCHAPPDGVASRRGGRVYRGFS